MLPVTKRLRPGAVTLIVFGVLVAFQACFTQESRTSTTAWLRSTTWFGWPELVEYSRTEKADGLIERAIHIEWLPLLLVAGVSYGLARLADILVMRRRGRWNPAKIVLAVMGGTTVLAFVAALGVSKYLWGYYFARPSLDRRIVNAKTVQSVTLVRTGQDDDGVPTLVNNSAITVARAIEAVREPGSDNPEGRALVALDDAKRSPAAAPAMSPEKLKEVDRILAETGRLETGGPGPHRRAHLDGAVIEAVGADGASLLFVGVVGDEVAQDHYPYDELLFAAPGPQARPRLLSAQRFYYSEGDKKDAQWPLLFLVFTLIGLFASVPTVLAVLAVRRLSLRAFLIVITVFGVALGQFVALERRAGRFGPHVRFTTPGDSLLVAIERTAIEAGLVALAYLAIRALRRVLALRRSSSP